MTFDLAARRLPRQPRAGSVRRPELPDALRGFVLFLMPMLSLLGASALEFAVSSAALLSLLFGMSFAMRVDRPGKKPAALRVLARRMLLESVAYRRLWVRLLKTTAVTGILAALLLQRLAPLAAALFICCMAAFVLLFQQARWRQWLRKLAPMGCIALTNWLLQVLAATVLFHALEPRFGLLLGVALPFAALPALQAVLSCRWLARTRRVPVAPVWHGLVSEGQAG